MKKTNLAHKIIAHKVLYGFFCSFFHAVGFPMSDFCDHILVNHRSVPVPLGHSK